MLAVVEVKYHKYFIEVNGDVIERRINWLIIDSTHYTIDAAFKKMDRLNRLSGTGNYQVFYSDQLITGVE
jgi:hypothetical protein